MRSCASLLVMISLAFTGFAAAKVPHSSHVWIITEENHSYEAVVGNAAMPYFNSLANKYALADQYYSDRHNSLSALMWLVAGQTVTLDNNTTACFTSDNVVRQILARGLTWKAYEEDLPYPGYQGLSWLNYARRHNPLIDFSDSCQSAQKVNSVPFTQLATDMANNDTPNYIYITPALQDDAHDGTLQQADAWLAKYVPSILKRPEFQPGGDGILFAVWDEGDLNADYRCSPRLVWGCGGRVATLLIGPQVKPGFRSQTLYTHENLLATVCSMMGFTACPGAGAVASPMSDFFNIVNIAVPITNTVTASAVPIRATATNKSPVDGMQVYVDNTLRYQTSATEVNTSLPVNVGSHHVVVQSKDQAGGIQKSEVDVTVQSEAVVVTSPAPNAVVGSPVLIQATGGGSSNVNTMRIYVDNSLQYAVSSNTVDTKLAMTVGHHYVVVEATDKSGRNLWNAFYVTVATPSVSIATPPANAWLYSPVWVSATTLDPSPVYAVQVYVDNVLQHEISGTGVQSPIAMAVGSHYVVVKALNESGKIYQSGVRINVKPVSVTISSPRSNATVTSPVNVQASVPSDCPVYTMRVYVDGVLQYTTMGTSVNTSLSLNPRSHYLVVEAWDAGGGIWDYGIEVTVK